MLGFLTLQRIQTMSNNNQEPRNPTVGWFYDTEYDYGVGHFQTEEKAVAASIEAEDAQ